MKKCIIFDAYGTIISTGTGSIDATRVIFEKYRLNVSNEKIYSKWKEFHKSNILKCKEFRAEKDIFVEDLKMLFDLYGVSGDPEIDIQPMLKSLLNRVPFPETSYVLRQLRNKYRIVIGSTTDTLPLLENLKRLDFEFDGIYTSEELRCYKPFPEFYEKILNNEGLNANDCYFVGDSLEDDVMGPRRVGIKSFFLDRKGKSKLLVNNYGDLNIINNLTELLETI